MLTVYTYITYIHFNYSQHTMFTIRILFCIFAKNKTSSVYKGASKQYQDPNNSTALVRTAQSQVYTFKQPLYIKTILTET